MGVENEVDELLGSLHDGLRRVEEMMVTVLERIVADNARFVSELEAALSDVEAALLTD